jgi:tetratricopeptide (TPR) repeat protein
MALVLFTASADMVTERGQAAYERGRRLYELGQDMPGALAALDEAVTLRPDHAESWLYKALVLEDVGGYARSRDAFATALRLGPGSKEIWRHHAEALAAAGELTRGEAYYLMAIALDPS